MRPDAADGPFRTAEALLDPLRARIDAVLLGFLAAHRAEIVAIAPEAVTLVDEIERLLRAGGKRIRSSLCYWGYRATGSADGEPIMDAAAAMELLHTFALIHDDVMDDADSRRGVPSTHRHLASSAGGTGGDPEAFGRSAAIVVGDVCAAFADELLLGAAFDAETSARAFRRFNRMRMEMAAGQLLDVGVAREPDEEVALRVSALKTGSYTIEGPLHVGAILGGAPVELLAMLSRYGAPLGEAFQVRDDLEAIAVGARGTEPAPVPAMEPHRGGWGANVVIAIAARLATPTERLMLDAPGTSTDDVLSIVASTGAAFRAAELRDELVRRSLSALDRSILPDEAGSALEGVALLIASPEV
jgi:geranylgeranyl diphosphate synthase type I